MFNMDSKLVMNIVMFGLLIFIFYFMIIRPNRKKEKEINEMRNGIKAGDEIITIGGICGKVVRVKEDSFILQVGASNTKIEMMRWGISKVTSKGKGEAPKKEENSKPLAKNIKKLVKKEEADTNADDSFVAEELKKEAKLNAED